MFLFSWVKKLFAPSKTQQLVNQVNQLTDELRSITTKQQKYDSTDPWVEITSEDFDERKGLCLGLDWNDAFISYLKESGITGSDDEEIVRKYLAYLYFDISERMEAKNIENSDKKVKLSDYQ